jgi:hypothetical protein
MQYAMIQWFKYPIVSLHCFENFTVNRMSIVFQKSYFLYTMGDRLYQRLSS